MKKLLLIFIALFQISFLFGQIKIIGDTAYYEGKKITLSVRDENRGMVQCKEYINKRLLKKYDALANTQLIDLEDWDIIEKMKLIQKHGNEYTFYPNGQIKLVRLYSKGHPTFNFTEYYSTGMKKKESNIRKDTSALINYFEESGKKIKTEIVKFNGPKQAITLFDQNGRKKFEYDSRLGIYDGNFNMYHDTMLIRNELFSSGKSIKVNCFSESSKKMRCPPFEERLKIGEKDDDYIKYLKILLEKPCFKNLSENKRVRFKLIINILNNVDSIYFDQPDSLINYTISEWAKTLPITGQKICGEPVSSEIEFYIVPNHSDYSIEQTENGLIYSKYYCSNYVFEQMPEFPGGTKALLSYLASNTKYPGSAVKNGIQGRVVLRFVIGPDGEISNITVLRSVSPEVDAEAIRVVKTMPKWKPGKQNGKVVPVYFTLPVSFKLAK